MAKASVAARAELRERFGYNPYEAAQRLVDLQARRGLTGRQLAEQMDAHESDVSRLRNAGERVDRGGSPPGTKLWQRAAEALGTSTEWLLGGKGPEDVEPPRKASLEDVLRAIDGVNSKLDMILAAVADGTTPPLDIHELVDRAVEAGERDPVLADRLTRAIASALAPEALPALNPAEEDREAPDPQHQRRHAKRR